MVKPSDKRLVGLKCCFCYLFDVMQPESDRARARKVIYIYIYIYIYMSYLWGNLNAKPTEMVLGHHCSVKKQNMVSRTRTHAHTHTHIHTYIHTHTHTHTHYLLPEWIAPHPVTVQNKSLKVSLLSGRHTGRMYLPYALSGVPIFNMAMSLP